MQKCIASTYGGLSHIKRNENTKRVHMVCGSVRVCSVQWTRWASPWPGGWLRVHVDVSCWGAGSWEYWVLCLDLGCWLAFCERVLVSSSQVLQIIWDPKSLPVAEALGSQIKGIRQEVTCPSTAMQKGPGHEGMILAGLSHPGSGQEKVHGQRELLFLQPSSTILLQQ